MFIIFNTIHLILITYLPIFPVSKDIDFPATWDTITKIEEDLNFVKKVYIFYSIWMIDRNKKLRTKISYRNLVMTLNLRIS